MITEKEKSHNNGEVPLLAFILQVGLGLYFYIMDIINIHWSTYERSPHGYFNLDVKVH